MPELLFGLMPNSTPEHTFKSTPKTPSPLSDITNCQRDSNQFTPRTYPEGNSMTPELEEDFVRAPCKLSLSPEDAHKPAKLSRRQLKFEDGVSLQSIGMVSKENNKAGEVFESNSFCDKKENSFVPLMPQRGKGAPKSRKRLEKQKSIPINAMQVCTQ